MIVGYHGPTIERSETMVRSKDPVKVKPLIFMTHTGRYSVSRHDRLELLANWDMFRCGDNPAGWLT